MSVKRISIVGVFPSKGTSFMSGSSGSGGNNARKFRDDDKKVETSPCRVVVSPSRTRMKTIREINIVNSGDWRTIFDEKSGRTFYLNGLD